MRVPFRQNPATYEEDIEVLRRMGELLRTAEQSGLKVTKMDYQYLLRQLRAERSRHKGEDSGS